MVNSPAPMLSLDDERWAKLQGGYRMPFDARPSLALLESGQCDKAAWGSLWDDLHHQGDVGDASYNAVPHLVQVCKRRAHFDWNIFGLVACIELCRDTGKNPPLPSWLESDYNNALQELAEIGASRLSQLTDSEDIRAALSVLALSKGARTHAKVLLNYSDEELRELEAKF